MSLALSESVYYYAFDVEGENELRKLFNGITLTDFNKDKIESVLSSSVPQTNWRVGEALATCYLTEHRGCYFPWPSSRDARTPKASLPGADLVGFQQDGDEVFFAFGEVKTSSEEQFPPGVIRGESGLTGQIQKLFSDTDIQNTLICYIGYRVDGDNKILFKKAINNWINSKMKVFGFLVRDVQPTDKDFVFAVENLKKHPDIKEFNVELLSVYLPCKSINLLDNRIMKIKEGKMNER